MSDSATAGVITPDELDETACRRRLIDMTRGERPGCPTCGTEFDEPRRVRLYAGKSVVCVCGVKSSALSGTMFDGTSLSCSALMFVIDRLALELSSGMIADQAECTPRTVQNWRKRLTAAGML